jgi:hypothetical protein
MNCASCGEWLDEYLENALPAAARAEVESHLALCAACREELDTCRRLADYLKELPHSEPGTEVCLRVSEAIHAEDRQPRRTEYGPVLDFDELAGYLRVDAATLEQYVGEIPCFELGGRLLFRKAKVEEWIERHEMRVGFRLEGSVAEGWSHPVNVAKGDMSWMLLQRN